MKNPFTFLILLLFPIITFCQETKKVLIIGIDGVRSDALAIANTPNIDNLIANGLFSPDALNDDITISGPGWSAILNAVWSNKHLVTNNDFSGNDYENFPPLTKYIEEFNPDFHTVSICHWGPINDNIVQDHIDFKLNVSSDAELSTQASSYLSLNDPDYMFLHFDEVDGAGYNSGFTPDNPVYINTIEQVDNLIGPILQAIEGRPNYLTEDWLILLTTDHGGIGTSHGGNTIEEQRVFFIASGNNVDQQLILRDSSVVIDSPNNCLGDTLELQFDGENDAVQIADNALFNFGPNQDFTIECRIRTSNAGDVAIVGNKNWDTGLNKGFVFSFKFPSGPEWKVNIGDGTNRADINTGGLVADNEWHTISVSFDRDGMMKMYQDGVFLSETDISFISDINTNQGLFFGTDINGGYDFTGSIAEVRVWNTILENTTINNWHCTTIDSNHPNFSNLNGYWKMNEGNGTQVQDLSANNNPGQINGPEWHSPDFITTYDYAETPRLVDISVTALTHLCIPINESWNLDGQSVIEDCIVSNNENVFLKNNFKVFPNPAKDKVEVQIPSFDSSQNLKLEILDSLGRKIYSQMIKQETSVINISTYPDGVYFFNILGENGKATKKIKISSKN